MELPYFSLCNVFKAHPCWHRLEFLFFSRPSSILCVYVCGHPCTYVYIHTHALLFTHSSVSHQWSWATCSFELLWIVLLWSWLSRSAFEILISVVLGIYSELVSLSHVVIACLLFWTTLYTGSLSCRIRWPHQPCMGLLISLFPHQYLFLSGCSFTYVCFCDNYCNLYKNRQKIW